MIPLRQIIENHYARMSAQLVDSSLESTRVYWRLKTGATKDQANDPRPFAEVMSDGH